MFQNKEKIFGIGTTPKSLGGMPFFIQLDVIPIRSEVRSSLLQVNEKEKINESSHYKGPTGTALLVELCEEQSRVIQHQEDKIIELQQQLSDYEYEIYGLDLQNYHLQKTGNLKDQTTSARRIHTGEN